MDTRLMQQIKKILKEFPHYWDGNELQRPIVIEDLKNYDAILIAALLKNQKVKENYSVKAGNVVIFKIQEFIDILRYKDYWADSYTKYSNTIGLSSEGKYLQYNTDIVLDFPYKDCVLEGGMTKEDTGKEEVFYNEVIARDEIDTLLAPKALVNVKKYDANGEHKVETFNDEDNLIIKGNNLLALYSLKERFAGKVKLIYIDPPYNTEEDSFKYNDKFSRSSWLTFMKNRFYVAKEFLKETGNIVVQISDKEMSYLKILMDEIFGEENHISTIIVKMSHLSGVKMAHKESVVPKTKEYLLVYAKDSSKTKIIPQYSVSKWENVLQRYSSFIDNYEQGFSSWKPISLNQALKHSGIDMTNETIVEQFKIDNAHKIYQTALNRGAKYPKEPYNVFLKHDNKFSLNGREVIFAKNKIKKINGKSKVVQIVGDIWNDIGINNVFQEGGDSIDLRFGKKPEMLLKRIISMFSNEGDIVLDYFMGTGTTASTSLKLKRKFIGIEQLDYIENLSVKRLNNVIMGDNTGISKDVNWQGGGSFVYAELMELNQIYMDKIDQTSTKKELINLWNELDNNADINFQLDKKKLTNELLREQDEEEGSITFNELTLEEQKKIFKKSLDKNQLYVPYSEIEDANVIISDNDKAFTRSFYNGKGE
ncbi:site-specific DNA-methyltransferase [Lactococcus lactis subsp. lactis]|nr:site-specific DNA-methyltransferase [Lactococcus lactis subsp. lactis]